MNRLFERGLEILLRSRRLVDIDLHEKPASGKLFPGNLFFAQSEARCVTKLSECCHKLPSPNTSRSEVATRC